MSIKGKEILICLPRVTETYFEVEGYAIALCVFVRDAGGQASACWEGNGIKTRIQGLSRKLVRLGTKVLINSTIAVGGTLSVIEQETDIAPMPDLEAALPWGTVLLRSPRLTKRLIFLLPSGAYIVSRCATNGRAKFAEQMGDYRDDAWRRAVEAMAAGRSCHLAWSVPQFEEERCLWPNVV